MNEKYEYINRELGRIEKSSSASYLSEKYLDEIETNLSKFHRGLVSFQVVDYQVCNGGFLQLFYNEYMESLDETICFFDDLKRDIVLDDFLDNIIKLFEKAIEIHTEYEEEIQMLDEFDEWYDDKVELHVTSYSRDLSPLDSKYYAVNETLWESLNLLAKYRFEKQSCF